MYGLPLQAPRYLLMRSVSVLALSVAIPELGEPAHGWYGAV